MADELPVMLVNAKQAQNIQDERPTSRTQHGWRSWLRTGCCVHRSCRRSRHPVGSEATLESLIQLVPAILEATGSGERDPQSPGELARGTLRNKIQQLADTLRGMFTDHHAFVTGGYLTQSRRPPS